MSQDSIKPLKDLLDNIRDIDGFPIGDDKNIIELSDPPFYTACPNPYIKQYIEEYGKPYNPDNDDYNKIPFIGDVSEGKTDPIYNAHTYHTKVPHKAIIKFIEYYTEKGDLIFDGFCGSGMTGIAAQLLERKAILGDLSTSAAFLSYNFNKSLVKEDFKRKAEEILQKIKNDLGWMFETNHSLNSKGNIKTISDYTKTKEKSIIKANVNYYVWSEVFICPFCENDYIFWDVAVNKENHKVKKTFNCLNCSAELKKSDCKRSRTELYDTILHKKINQIKKVPVLINYSVNNKRYGKSPDKDDVSLIEEINKQEIPYWIPLKRMPEGEESRRNDKYGITHVHHFYTKRNLWILAYIYHLINEITNKRLRNLFKVLIQSFLFHSSILNRKVPGGIGRHLSGTLYVPSLSCEISIYEMFKRKLKDFQKSFYDIKNNIITTSSLTGISKLVPENSIDYIFTDPPFGSNLMYSELSFIWEAWLEIFTNNKTEAIINKVQNKELYEYSNIMTLCFKEMNKILKPNRWMTVVFHNSKASVWNAIQESINRAGFIIAQVSVLDKKQGSFKQVNSIGAVKNDLIINTYKPKREFSETFIKNAGENMELKFVEEHLRHLPIRPNIERIENMIFSKLLAHYVENGYKIGFNASTFFKLLDENLIEIDGYWFLEDQVKIYNEWKRSLSLDQIKEMTEGQQILFVNDEKSALTWMYNFLNTPKDYSEIYTAFNQVVTKITDNIPELKELLNINFLLDDGKYRRAKSIEEKLRISKNREKELKRAYDKILKQAKEKKAKIKKVRIEALIYGFNNCYNQSNFEEILTVAEKLYQNTIESNGAIMDFIDIAKLKTNH